MDWKDVGKRLADDAPQVATELISGNAPGAVGTLVSSVLGLDSDSSPKTVADELDKHPKTALKLKKLNLEQFKAKLSAETAQVQAINKTMRAESGNHWRSAIGWSTCAAMLLMVGTACFSVLRDPGQLQQATNVMSWVIGSGALMNGINLYGDHRVKQTMLGGNSQSGGWLSAVAKSSKQIAKGKP